MAKRKLDKRVLELPAKMRDIARGGKVKLIGVFNCLLMGESDLVYYVSDLLWATCSEVLRC